MNKHLTNEEKKKRFREGYNTPIDQLLDMSLDTFAKETGWRDKYVSPVTRSELYRENYDKIRWNHE